MRIIGHRGAAGLELENTRASIKAGLKYADVIEIDVRLTADRHLVLMHDADTARVSEKNLVIAEHTLAQLQKLKLKNSEQILTLDEALELVGRTPIVIEIKDKNSSKAAAKAVNRHPKAQVIFESYYFDELRQAKELYPNALIYTRSLLKEHPFNLLHPVFGARRLGADGVAINQRLLVVPFIYWLARIFRLKIFCYPAKPSKTPKNLRWTRLATRVYPNLDICTDFPDYLRKKLQSK